MGHVHDFLLDKYGEPHVLVEGLVLGQRGERFDSTNGLSLIKVARGHPIEVPASYILACELG